MNVWEDLYAEHTARQAEYDPAVGPSDARVLHGGGCRRELAYRTRGVPTSDPVPEKVARAAVLGEAIHDRVALARSLAGWTVEEEVDMRALGFQRNGRLDARRDGWLDDLKTVSRFVFDQVVLAGKARPGDVAQTELYALAVGGIHTCSVTYLNRETGEPFTDSWSYDDARAWETLGDMLELIEQVTMLEPADFGRAARVPTDRPCDTCQWRSTCWGRDLTAPPEEPAPLAPAAIAALASQLQAAMVARGELEDRIEELRYQLAGYDGHEFEDAEGIRRRIRWSAGREPGDGGALDQRAARALLQHYGEQPPTLGTSPRLTFPATR